MNNDTYDEFINNILNTRGRFSCGEIYHERHHIKPKCIGGADDEENLIDLFASEHYIAHKLLSEENPDNEKLVYSWWCMASMNNGCFVSSDEYEKIKQKMAECLRVNRVGNNNPFYGRKHSEDTKTKISESEKGEKNPMFGKRLSYETRKKISENHADMSGSNNGMSKSVQCIETGEIFYSVVEAMKWCGLRGSSDIGNCIKGKTKSAGKHPDTHIKLHWKWV